MKARAYQKIHTGDRVLDKMQSNVEDAVSQAIKAVLLNGILLSDLSLSTTQSTVNHKLGRTPIGFFVVGNNAAAVVYSSGASDDLNLYLKSSASCTASLWVF